MAPPPPPDILSPILVCLAPPAVISLVLRERLYKSFRSLRLGAYLGLSLLLLGPNLTLAPYWIDGGVRRMALLITLLIVTVVVPGLWMATDRLKNSGKRTRVTIAIVVVASILIAFAWSEAARYGDARLEEMSPTFYLSATLRAASDPTPVTVYLPLPLREDALPSPLANLSVYATNATVAAVNALNGPGLSVTFINACSVTIRSKSRSLFWNLSLEDSPIDMDRARYWVYSSAVGPVDVSFEARLPRFEISFSATLSPGWTLVVASRYQPTP